VLGSDFLGCILESKPRARAGRRKKTDKTKVVSLPGRMGFHIIDRETQLFKGHAMSLITAVVALSIAAASAATKAADKGISLDSLIQNVVANGRDGALPGPIAASIGIPENTPYRGVRVPADQATDGTDHVIKVLVEKSAEGDALKAACLELNTGQTRTADQDHYLYHASLDGKRKT
jgi:hypothetical protein